MKYAPEKRERKERYSPMDSHRCRRAAYCKSQHTVIIIGGQYD